MIKSRIRFTLILAFFFMLGRPGPSWAQTGGMQGQVKVKQADGSMQPAANVVIDFYRLDIKGEYHTKSDKSGRYAHIGLPFGNYVIILSGQGLNPYYEYNVRVPPGAPMERNFELLPGSGKRLTLDEVKQYQAQAKTGGGPGQQQQTPQMTAEQQRQMEEAVKKQEEQKKAAARDEEMIKHFEAGKQLAQTSQYEPAIAEFKQALEKSPDHPQLYIVLGNMAKAYADLAVEQYNGGQRQVAVETFALAAETAKKAADMVPADKAADKPSYLTIYANALANTSRLDKTKVDVAVAAYQELMNAQTTPADKLKSQIEIAKIYLNAIRTDDAVAAYRKVLETDQNNLDALHGLGMALVQTGDATKYQEVIDVMTKFTDKASRDQSRAAQVEEANGIIMALKEAMKQQPKKRP
jgi:tetratricopeptide (TPR) repeat protein